MIESLKQQPSHVCVFDPDLLEKSLRVLTSSDVLLQKLRQLQRTEALQRRGVVLQGKDDDAKVTQLHGSAHFPSSFLHFPSFLLQL